MKIAVFPGSFDPITNGHVDILERIVPLFDKIIVLVAINPNKQNRFSHKIRIEMIKSVVQRYSNVEVDFTDGYTVDYAKSHGANYLIRGLRNATDFKYEYELALANKKLNSNIETIFLLTDEKISSISSSDVYNLYINKKDISNLVPKEILKYLI